MSYFEKMPKIEYPFPDFPNMEMLDIFRRVSFTRETLKDKGNFSQHTITEGQKPEDIAHSVYGDSRLWWVLLLANNIIDYRNEWPKSQRELSNIFENFLNGRSLYVMENLPVKRGDVVVRRDVNATQLNDDDEEVHTSSLDMDTYGVVDDYDTLFHKINLKKTKGTINSGDEIYIFRKGITAQGSSGAYYPIEGFGQTGCYRPWYGATTCVEITGPESNDVHTHWGSNCCTLGSTFAIVHKAVDIKDSAVRFKFKGDEANPYGMYDENDGISGDFFGYKNLCGLTSTILYKWIKDELPIAINPITMAEDIYEVNDKNRTINVLSIDLIPQLLEEIGMLLGVGVPRGTIKLLQY